MKTFFFVCLFKQDINSITVAPNDKLLATGSQDKTAKVYQWKLLNGVAVQNIKVQKTKLKNIISGTSQNGCLKTKRNIININSI